VRGRPPVNQEALENLVVRFSQLIVEQPVIKELDINPVLASHDTLLALDARVVLYSKDIPADQLPRPAIRPYPAQYIGTATLRSGVTVTIRPIRPDDEPRIVAFHETLSERSVELRYYHPFALSQRVAHERLQRISHNDYDREIALVALTPEDKLIAVARLSRQRNNLSSDDGALFNLLVTDEFQNQGLGTELLNRLIEVARGEGVETLFAEILAVNEPMQMICQKAGFTLSDPHGDPSTVRAELHL